MPQNRIQAEKKHLRQQCLAAHKRLSEQQRAQSDAALFTRLWSCATFTKATSVFLYLGIDFEPDTLSLLSRLWANGVQVSVPLCGHAGVMEARHIENETQLSLGFWGLWTPARTCPVVPPASLDCILVPGLAFDKTGGRLGRGGGYYDRYLQGLSVPALALCRQAFLMDSLPCLPHDQKVHTVITEDQTLVPS